MIVQGIEKKIEIMEVLVFFGKDFIPQFMLVCLVL